jgi:hypothetical protein
MQIRKAAIIEFRFSFMLAGHGNAQADSARKSR